MSSTELTPVSRLSRDLAKAAISLSRHEARYLVDTYYQMQEDRKRASNQARALITNSEPANVVEWLARQSQTLEQQIKRALDTYSATDPVGEWSRGIIGIGPVIAAGLLAHIDITKAPTVGHIWRYAGLDPTVEWGKGQKRPWNAQLKTLCWKIGESFVKVSGNPDSFYGEVYKKRKEWELQRNEEGLYADQAAKMLAKFKIGTDTTARKFYEAGKLPPGHIHARAKRYAVKLFLSQWHEVAYRQHYGTEPPKPYAIDILKHAHHITADMVN
jgi:hypothetical protein